MFSVFPLEWDSTFFNLRIGKVVIRSSRELDDLRAKKDFLKNAYDLIYVLIEGGTLFFDDADAILADRKVCYSQHLTGGYRHNAFVHVFKESCPNQELYQLALWSGEYSRFKVDPLFPADGFERLYRRWIERSVDNDHSHVFCYYGNGVIVGMMTVDLLETSHLGRIGLTAVHPAYSGIGIGSALIEETRFFLYEKGITHFETVTQMQNMKACRWYEKNGFTIDSINNVYHWWLNKPRDYENSIQ